MGHGAYHSLCAPGWRCPSAGCQADPTPCALLAMPTELCSAPSVPCASFSSRRCPAQLGYLSLNSTPNLPHACRLVLPYRVVGKSCVRMKISSYSSRQSATRAPHPSFYFETASCEQLCHLRHPGFPMSSSSEALLNALLGGDL